MNSITIADLRNRFSDVSTAIRHGEKLLVTMRGVPFATLSPVGKTSKTKLDWPDRSAWRARIFPQKPSKEGLTGVLDYDRGDT